MTPVTRNLAREILRGIRNNKAEFTDQGIFIGGGANLMAFGHFTAQYAAPGCEFGPNTIGSNRVVKEGLIEALNLIANHAAPVARYLAPFSGDVVVSADWKGSNFASSATEFTNYEEAARLAWTTVAATTSPLVSNTAALATTVITLSAGGPYTIRGCALLTSSVKGGTAGRLFSAARYGDDLTGMVGGGKLGLGYGLAAADEGDM